MSRFLHEEFFDWKPFKRRHPDAVIRTKVAGDHRIRIVYFGAKRDGRHSNSKVFAVLHPANENPTCPLKESVRKNPNLWYELVK